MLAGEQGKCLPSQIEPIQFNRIWLEAWLEIIQLKLSHNCEDSL
jgi:hypothetical protein